MFTYIATAFPVLIWGVSRGGWWFEEMSALFLGVALLLMFFSGLSEKDAVNTFIAGAGDLVGVVLTIGLARSINIVMDNGFISDTLLYYSTEFVAGMGKGTFAIAQLLIFSVFRFLYTFIFWTCCTFYAYYGSTCRYSWSIKRSCYQCV